MAGFKDKDEFLDAFYDHMFPEGEDPDDDFFDHVAKFFDQFDGSNNQNSGGNGPNPPRRRRAQSGGSGSNSGGSRRRSRQTSSGYGNASFFGN